MTGSCQAGKGSNVFMSGKIRSYLKLARVQHWIKNFLVFLPLTFGIELFNMAIFAKTVVGFFAFCFLSSTIYVINDLQDLEMDKLHPTKRNRPLAAGDITVGQGKLYAVLLFNLSVVLHWIASGTTVIAWVYYVLYLVLNMAYSYGLKNVPLLDIMILSSGFVLRLLYGGAISHIAISHWLYLLVITFSFFLGFSKRRNELKKTGDHTRKVLKGYTQSFLDKNMYMCLTLTNVFYILWCLDQNEAKPQNGMGMIWSIPVVLVICIRYSMIIEGDSYGDPVEVLLGDKLLLGLVAGYALLMLSTLYGGPIRVAMGWMG